MMAALNETLRTRIEKVGRHVADCLASIRDKVKLAEKELAQLEVEFAA
jgi:hypothetical protein